MSNNIAFTGNGEVFGVESEIGIIISKNDKVLFVKFTNENSNLNNLLSNNEVGIAKLDTQLSILSKPNIIFTALLVNSREALDFSISLKKDKQSAEIIGHVFRMKDVTQLAIKIERDFFDDRNSIEKFIKNILDFLSLEKTILILRNKELTSLSSDYFRKIAEPKGFPVYVLEKELDKKLVSFSEFDLENGTSSFAKGVYSLTGVKKLDLVITKAADSPSPSAKLICRDDPTVDNSNKNYKLSDLQFEIDNSKFKAGGNITLFLKDKVLKFNLKGALTLNSFSLAASSLDEIALNSKYKFSSLSLIVGVGASGVLFGMTGRISITKSSKAISIYGGFVVSQLNIPLITSAVSSTDGRISLMDLVVEIAEIDMPDLIFLDKIAIGDFEIHEGEENTLKFPRWKEKPPLNSDAEVISKFNKVLSEDFNKFMPAELQLKENENIEVNYIDETLTIFTDKKYMRHYRVNSEGVVSLNCQIYLCSEPIVDMPVGFFFCGTLEIFSVKARALFYLNPSVSITAVVQISPINYNGIFNLNQSKEDIQTDIEEIEGGMAGELIPKKRIGPTVYLNVNAVQKKIELFVSVNLKILSIIEVDVFVLIIKNMVRINYNTNFEGLNVSLYVEANYENFSSGNFESKLKIDTNGFFDAIKNAQDEIKAFAAKKKQTFENAQQALNNAQRTVLGLKNTIAEYNYEISELKKKISIWHPIDSGIAIAKITGYETAIISLNVSMGVAYGALTIAKAALSAGDYISDAALASINLILNCVTEILWLKLFEIQIKLSPTTKEISGRMVLHVLGEDVDLSGAIDLAKIQNNNFSNYIKEFVRGYAVNTTKSKLESTNTFMLKGNEEEDLIKIYFENLDENIHQYKDLMGFQIIIEDFIYDLSNVNYEVYGSLSEEWQLNVTEASDVLNQNDLLRAHCVNFYDDSFVEALKNTVGFLKENKQDLQFNYSSDEPEPSLDDFDEYIKNVEDLRASNSQFKSSNKSQTLYERIEEIKTKNKYKYGFKGSEQEEPLDPKYNKFIVLERMQSLQSQMPIKETNTVMREFKTNMEKMIYEKKNE